VVKTHNTTLSAYIDAKCSEQTSRYPRQ